jgi:hypothetical protein
MSTGYETHKAEQARAKYCLRGAFWKKWQPTSVVNAAWQGTRHYIRSDTYIKQQHDQPNATSDVASAPLSWIITPVSGLTCLGSSLKSMLAWHGVPACSSTPNRALSALTNQCTRHTLQYRSQNTTHMIFRWGIPIMLSIINRKKYIYNFTLTQPLLCKYN